ncbi:MAG: VOC family protein [Opitutaceae bacterium]|jgi:predicted enzyme related to lactoylglutathione lyase|nr:VOC family protein [Opitutaceae bacterium]
MIRVKEIAFTGYPVTDMPRARAFYEGLLHLVPSTTFEHEGKSWIEYDVGASTLAITNMSDRWKPSADGPSAALEVENFDEAIAAAKAAGITFYIEPMDSSVCWLAVVADPDGNAIALHHRHAHTHA